MITTATMHCSRGCIGFPFQAHRKPGHGPYSARRRSDARRQSAACHGCGIFRPEPASACDAGTATGDCRRPAPAIRARFSLPSSSAPPAGRGTGHLSGLRCLLHIGHQGIMGGGGSGAGRIRSRAAVVLRAQSDGRRRGRTGNSEKRPGPGALLQQRRIGLSSAPPARLIPGSHGRCPAPFARIAPPPLLYPDQDALNLLFRRLPLHWLGERFNYQLHVAGRWLLPPGQLEGRLLHFCGRKPWCEPLCPSALGHLENYRFLEQCCFEK